MSRIFLLLLLIPVWCGGVWGSLQIHKLDLNLGHSICGPWGCGPPVEALLGMHAFWITMLFPVVAGVGLYCSPSTRRTLGFVAIAIGLLLVVVVSGRATYGLWTSSGSTEFLLQKFLFTIATSVDVPMLQVLLAGCGLAWWGRPVSASSQSEVQRAPQLS